MKNKTPEKLDNLKSLISKMDSKIDFVDNVSQHYNLSYLYVLQNWFQARWKVPQDKMDEIIRMAQNYLFEQTKRHRALLLETGFEIQE